MTQSIRKQILARRGVDFSKHQRKIRTHDELPTAFKKTNHMKFIEIKYGASIETLLKHGSCSDVAARIHIERTTVSKWRKAIRNGGDSND